MSKRPFGFIRVRPGRAKPYLAAFNPPRGGNEVSQSFATEEEADVWLASQHVSSVATPHLDPRGPRTLLSDWWPAFLAERQLAPTSVETYQRHWHNHIGPAFGHRELGSLRRGEIQAWVNRLPLAARTTGTVLAVLQSALKAAVVDDLLIKSPAVGVKPPRVTRRQLVIPTAEEIEAIAAAIHPPYAIAVRLAAEAGLREGEILGLHVEDLDLLRRRLHVTSQAQTLAGGVQLGLPLKSESAYRQVPLAPETVTALAAHLAGRAGRSLVVTTASGKPVRRQNLLTAWGRALTRAGVDRPLRIHDLRHRYASVLIAANLDALTVKTLMGHSSITETYDTYGHLFPNQHERAAEAIALSIYARTEPRTTGDEGAAQGV